MGQAAPWTGGPRDIGRAVSLWTVAESLYACQAPPDSSLEEGFAVRALITEALPLPSLPLERMRTPLLSPHLSRDK